MGNEKRIVFNCESSEESSLIRVEMNSIEYPLFTRNRNIEKGANVKYQFSTLKNSYIEIKPPNGDRIPAEFEEKLFYGFLKKLSILYPYLWIGKEASTSQRTKKERAGIHDRRVSKDGRK